MFNARRGGGTPPTGFGAVPTYPAQPPSFNPYGPPPYYPQNLSSDPNARYYMDQLFQQLNDARRELAELRGQPPPPPVQGMPPVSPEVASLRAEMAEMKAMLRGAVGLGRAPTDGDQFQSMAGALVRDVTQRTFAKLREGFQAGLDEAFSPAEPEPINAAPAVPLTPEQQAAKENADAREDLPYRAVQLEGRWADGRPVVYPKSKDGSGPFGMNLAGFVMENPWLMEKGVGVVAQAASAGVGKITEALGTAAQRMVAGAAQQAPQIGLGANAPQRTIDTTGTPVVAPPPPESPDWSQKP
jgi:hypothetical protein